MNPQRLNNLVSDPKTEELKKSLAKSVTQTMKHIAPTLSKGIFKKISGVNWDDLSDDTEQSTEDKENIKLGGELASISTKAILNLHVEQQNSIEDLKTEVDVILSKVLTDDISMSWSPMYVFIDELDRCRPTFAIEVLEVIKHIFDIPRIIFVIATDTEQLQHSIKAVYGHDFDAEKYLMRFFNRSFSLPTPKLKDFLNQLPGIAIIKERLILTESFEIFEIDDSAALRLITTIFEGAKLDLRAVNQIIERVSSILIHHEDEKGVILLLVLECIRTKQQSLFDKLWANGVVHGGSSSNSFNNFMKELGVTNENSMQLPENENVIKFYEAQLDIYENSNTSSQCQNTTQLTDNILSAQDMSLWSIASFLVKQINHSTKITPISTDYNKQTAYYLTSIENGHGGINRFKDYVELASNLS